jgi:hypothetical protein
MQGSQRADEAILQGLQLAEDAVNTWAKNTKLYWMMWGPLAKPMVDSIDAWADTRSAAPSNG